jgi:hypothetical protein
MKKQNFILILSLFLMANPAMAKKHKAKAFSFFEDNAKVSQGECDGEGKIPKRLKRNKSFTSAKDYLGSEMQDSDKVWKHFFVSQATCNHFLAKARGQ